MVKQMLQQQHLTEVVEVADGGVRAEIAVDEGGEEVEVDNGRVKW